MKTESEVIEYINSVEAITRKQLSEFIYGRSGGYSKSGTFNKYWDYVLRTKDWAKLREHKHKRIYNRLIAGKFQDFQKIWIKDKRLKELGVKRGTRFLRDVYNLEVSDAGFKRYKKKCLNPQ